MDDAPISRMSEVVARSSDDIEQWLVTKFAELLNIGPEQIDVTAPITDFQIDSSAAVTVTNDLSEWLGTSLAVTLFWEYPTMRSLALELATAGFEDVGHEGRRDDHAARN
jgi:acyl carrier protein